MTTVTPIYIEDEIKASFLDYSMSVIVSRALPDVRDGLKPVHRRILFAMNELGMTHDKPFKKSARIVGEVLGKYHPHGDTAVYDTMVRMAQDFNLRYTLISGHGNFGSIDGDSAAAMRYTEARMSKEAEEILVDLEKNTVDFRKNFDETLDEPQVLPSKLPNLLINGSAGIAVGMATNIPPHNLCEVSDGIVAMVDNPLITIDELMMLIKGPDFPTAGEICGTKGIYDAYHTGKGKVRLRGKARIEEFKTGKEAIIIEELPYQVNKARLIERIAEMVKEKKIVGITDLRDESNREGIRVVIEVKRGENSELVLNSLYKYTDLSVTFGIIMLALVENVPKVLNLKEILEYFIKHRFNVITRRTIFELDKAEKRAHILEGFRIALDHIDEVVSIIRNAKDTETAKINLMERFALSEEQTKAILEMRLRTLTGLEREKIEEEYQKLMVEIERLRGILADEGKVYQIIKDETLELKEKYGDERRTEIKQEEKDINIEDLIKDEEVIVTITNKGYVKRITLDKYREQKRGGKGASSHQVGEEDVIEDMYTGRNLDNLLVYTNKGKVFSIKVYEIPEASKAARGKLISNIVNLGDDEKVSAVIRVREFEENKYVMFVTAQGVVKKVELNLFKSINKSGLKAINLNEDDDLIFVGITSGNDEVVIATKKGISIRFNENDVRSMGRAATGVKGITLKKNDTVVSAVIIKDTKNYLLTIMENGYVKMTPVEEYRMQTRGGMGVINAKPSEKTGNVVQVKEVKENDSVLIVTSNGVVIRTNLTEVRTTSRGTQGVIMMRVGENEKVVSIVQVKEEEEPSEEEGKNFTGTLY